MVRLAWATDIHLNFAPKGPEALCEDLRRTRADAFLLAGDIAEAPTLVPALEVLERHSPCPVYFVLGNHDFYKGSIAAVRREVAAFVQGSRRLKWLNLAGVVPLTAKTCLVGHDGWGDARYGDVMRSDVVLNDFRLIAELSGLRKSELRERLEALGDEAAAHFRQVLPDALARFEHVYVLTHVPPFREACWHQGRMSDDAYLPFFACKASGDALAEAMRPRRDRLMTVLCGHTHGGGESQPLSNLRVFTGPAEYGEPKLQPQTFDLI